MSLTFLIRIRNPQFFVVSANFQYCHREKINTIKPFFSGILVLNNCVAKLERIRVVIL